MGSVSIWGIGSVIALLFFGLGWVLVWSVGFCAYWNFHKNWLHGLGVAVVGFAFFFGPPIMDQSVIERQIENTTALEIVSEPIDLTGKTVVFLGRNNVWNLSESEAACDYVCDAIARHGGAKAVLFGQGQGTSLYRPSDPIDLTSRELYSYEQPIVGSTPITSPYVPATVDTVDYVVVSQLLPSHEVESELKNAVGSYVFYPGDVRIDYQIVPVTDPTAVDLYAAPLFSALRLVRYEINAPYLPGLSRGYIHSRHWQQLPKDHGWANDTTYRALDVLCGPIERPNHGDCVTALDANPHYN